MKTLLLLRHAKSSWSNPAARDHDRRLTTRGHQAATSMGGLLRQHGLVPELAVISPARRARETWERVLPELRAAPEAKTEDRLYMAEPPTLLRIVHDVPASADTVLLIGHNPGLERFAAQLAGSAEGDARQRMAKKFPTAALAVLRFDLANWAGVKPSSGRLDAFFTPRETDD